VTTVHRREVVRLPELADRRSLIENHQFEDCEVLGPAILVPLDHVDFGDVAFDAALDAVFYEIEGDRGMTGVIGLRRVSFRACRLRNVGVMATHEVIEKLRRAATG